MATTAFKGKAPKKSEGGDFHNPPAGSHPAVLVAMIDLGTQDEDFEGKPRKVHQVYLVWELTAEQLPGSTFNHALGKVFTLSFHEKGGLRKLAEKWRGKAYNAEDEIDYGAMLGKSCLLTVEHKTNKAGDRTYANFAGVSPVPKGLSVPAASAHCWPGRSPPATSASCPTGCRASTASRSPTSYAAPPNWAAPRRHERSADTPTG